jgi:hypothetical protein
MTPQHHISHHKHHQHHGSNSGRLHQAAVGVISRERLVPYTASTITTTPSSKLSPLDRLMNRLDLEERQTSQINHQSRDTRFGQGNGRYESSYPGSYPVSSAMLRSSADHRYARLRSHNTEDSYEDDDEDEDDDDEDVVDDAENIRDEDDEDDDNEDEDDDGNEDEERLSRSRHQNSHRNHKTGHTADDVTWVSVSTLCMFLF